jgi:hypothetical protein
MTLFDAADAARFLSEKLDSREWWVFIGASRVLSAIEERHYSGEANADFQVLIGPPAGPFVDVFPNALLLPLTFAHKRHMNSAELARMLRSQGAIPEVLAADLESRDVLYMYETDGSEEAR